MPTIFTAPRLLPINVLFPGRLEIDDLNVTYYKGTILGYHSTVVARSSISSVSIHKWLFFGDVIIEAKGGRKIVVFGFKKSDAKTIVMMLS